MLTISPPTSSSQRGFARQRRPQQLRADTHHLGVTAEREADRVDAAFAERITRRAADAVRREARRQLVGAIDAKLSIELHIELGPDVERAARRERSHTRHR